MSKEFDKIVKNKLDNYSSQESSDWEDFSEILDEELGLESFDENIASKIEENFVGFDDMHWEMLKDRLDEEERVVDQVNFIKYLELISALVLFLLVWNSIWTSGLTTSHYYAEAQQRYKSEMTTDKNIALSLGTNRAYDLSSSDANLNTTNEQYANFLHLSLKNISLKGRNVNLEFLSNYEIEPIQIEDIEISALETLALNLSTSYVEMHSNIYIPDIEEDSGVDKKPSIGIYAAANEVQVNTPFDKISNAESYSKTTSSNEFGFYISKPISDNLRLRGGLGYKSISYAPKEITEISSYANAVPLYTNISSIEYNIMSVPLSVGWKFLEAKSLEFGLLVGFSSHFVMHSQFDVSKSLKGGERNELSDGENVLLQKDFNVGILDGGSIMDNYFTTVDIGLDLALKVNNDFTLNFSPRYSRHIFGQGIGPNMDKIHTASLQLGIEYNL